MKKSRKTALLLTTLVCLGVLSGCSSKPVDVESVEIGKNSTVLENGHRRMNEPVELSYLIYEHTEWPINDESPVYEKMFEETNVKINSIVAPASNFDEKFNVAIMGDPMPDLMMSNKIDVINEYGGKGVFIPLEDLIAEYAPNINALLDDEARKMITAGDGHIYALPRFGQSQLHSGWLIRKDWLDELGLDVPQTTDDWIEVLKQFKEKDPGNAGENLVPLMNRNGSSVFLQYTAPTFGLHPDGYTKKGDAYVLNATTDEYKSMLEWYNALYEAGLFDQEFVTTTSKQWEEGISAGYVGATIDFVARTDTFTDVLKLQDENAEFVTAPPPVSPYGTQGVKSYSDILTTTVVGITKDCKDIEAALTWLDYLYSDDGAWLTSVGIEGLTYTGVNEDGSPIWTDEILNNPNNMAITSKYGIQQQMCPRVMTEYEVDLIQGPLAKQGRELCEPYYVEPYYPAQYTKEESEAMTNYNTVVTPIINQYTDQFISGVRPMSDWDVFQEELQKAGAEEMGKIFTDAMLRKSS